MKNEKNYLIVMTIIFLMLLTGCNKTELPESAYPSQDEYPDYYEDIEDQTEVLESEVIPDHISEEADVSGIHIVFDADVNCGTWSEVSHITLQYDDEKSDVISGWLSDGILQDEAGFISYHNPELDLNGSGEDEHLGERGYITDVIPTGMSESSQEIGDRTAGILSNCSDFDFYLDSSRSQTDETTGEGFYYMKFNAAIDGIDISPFYRDDYQSNAIIGGIAVSVMESGEGIFYFNGRVPFKISDRTPILPACGFDDYIDRFKEDIVNISGSQNIVVENIRLVYLPSYNDDGSIELAPVIVFDCLESDFSMNEMIAYSYQSPTFICVLY